MICMLTVSTPMFSRLNEDHKLGKALKEHEKSVASEFNGSTVARVLISANLSPLWLSFYLTLTFDTPHPCYFSLEETGGRWVFSGYPGWPQTDNSSSPASKYWGYYMYHHTLLLTTAKILRTHTAHRRPHWHWNSLKQALWASYLHTGLGECSSVGNVC